MLRIPNADFSKHLSESMEAYLKNDPAKGRNRYFKPFCTPEGISKQLDDEIAEHPTYARIQYGTVEDEYGVLRNCVINFENNMIYRVRFTGMWPSNEGVIEKFENGGWVPNVADVVIRPRANTDC